MRLCRTEVVLNYTRSKGNAPGGPQALGKASRLERGGWQWSPCSLGTWWVHCVAVFGVNPHTEWQRGPQRKALMCGKVKIAWGENRVL